jgi:hypothetical protein
MARKPEATSIPPDTGEIDSDWNETSSVLDAMDRNSAGPTAVPPEPYESYAKRASHGQLTDEQARRALSAPSMPIIDTSDVDELLGIATRDSGEMDVPIPMLGQQPSGPYEIPLELGDDGTEIRASERPTMPQLEPPPAFAGTPTPKVDAPDQAQWGDEAPTPTGTSPEALRALLKSSARGRPVLRRGAPVDGPEISVSMSDAEDLDLDEPEGINMEDSLELSLDNIPPAPFDLSPSPADLQPPTTRKVDATDSLELSLDDDGDALDLVAARATPATQDPNDPLIDLRDRYAVGDFTGAHEIAESILAEDPTNSEALRFRESCRDVLTQMYTARLGSTEKVPRLAIPAAELQWLSLDHRAGFLLSCVDGRSSIEEILDVSGMPALDALRILYTLLQQQIIEVVGD